MGDQLSYSSSSLGQLYEAVAMRQPWWKYRLPRVKIREIEFVLKNEQLMHLVRSPGFLQWKPLGYTAPWPPQGSFLSLTITRKIDWDQSPINNFIGVLTRFQQDNMAVEHVYASPDPCAKIQIDLQPSSSQVSTIILDDSKREFFSWSGEFNELTHFHLP